MKNLKSIIMGIMIVFCLLTPHKIALGLEVIPPVQVSEQSLEVKKITEKKKEKGEHLFLLPGNSGDSEYAFIIPGIIKADKDETPDQVFKKKADVQRKRISMLVVRA